MRYSVMMLWLKSVTLETFTQGSCQLFGRDKHSLESDITEIPTWWWNLCYIFQSKAITGCSITCFFKQIIKSVPRYKDSVLFLYVDGEHLTPTDVANTLVETVDSEMLLVFWSTRCFFFVEGGWTEKWVIHCQVFFLLTGAEAAVCLSERVYWSLHGDVLLNRCDATF